MMLLDAAKTMADQEPLLEEYGTVHACVYCRAPRFSNHVFIPEQPHETTCPWLTLPRIAAVLEAARELVDEVPLHTDGVTWTCGFCHGEQPDTELTDDEPFPHDARCPWQAVAAALTGYPA